jgi:hypothetical protein
MPRSLRACCIREPGDSRLGSCKLGSGVGSDPLTSIACLEAAGPAHPSVEFKANARRHVLIGFWPDHSAPLGARTRVGGQNAMCSRVLHSGNKGPCGSRWRNGHGRSRPPDEKPVTQKGMAQARQADRLGPCFQSTHRGGGHPWRRAPFCGYFLCCRPRPVRLNLPPFRS